MNRVDITESEKLFIAGEFEVDDKKYKAKKIDRAKIIAAPRVGIDYAGEDAKLLLRFYI